MDIKRISPYPDHCTVTLDIPWDVAEALVSAGPGLISSLRDVVRQHKQAVDGDENLNKYRNNQADTPQQEWQAMAEVADKRIRYLVSEEKLSFSKAISITAKERHFPPSSLHALIANYRRTAKEETAKLRTIEIIRLYFKGVSNRDIGKHFNISTRSVQSVLSEHEDIIRFTRNQIITENPEPKRETRKEQKARFLRRDAEIIEQHHRGAGAYRLARRYKLTIQTIRKILKTCDVTTSALNYDLKIERRKERHGRIGVQLYRRYRRIRPNSRESGNVHKELAEQFSGIYGECPDLSPIYVSHLIRVRRDRVKAYINKRRLATILRLEGQKQKNTNIAQIIGLHEKTVARILRDHKASQTQGEAS